MADPFGRLAKGLVQGRELRRQGQNDRLDQALKQAQLQEAGYSWDGNQLMQQPGYVSAKALEREKLQNEIEFQNIKKENMKRFGQQSFGGGASTATQSMPDASSNGDQSVSPFIVNPLDGSLVKNPDHMNPVQRKQAAMLDAKQRAEQEAEKNKTDMLREQATGQLRAIQEAKKGKKYFGMFGNLPSQFVPSSYPVVGVLGGGASNPMGEYGPRKEWENNVNKLLSGRVLDTMNQLKSASKTGATGFGALNQSELQILQQASNVLSKDLPPDLAEKYLNELEPIYMKVLGSGGQGQQQFGQPVQQPAQEQIQDENVPYIDRAEALAAGATEEQIQAHARANGLRIR